MIPWFESSRTLPGWDIFVEAEAYIRQYLLPLRTAMSDDSSDRYDSSEAADEIVDAVTEHEPKEDVEDGLTKREREIARRVDEERRKKGEAVMARLRERRMGMLNYRWPAAILVGAGILSIWSEFLTVMIHPPGIGFDSYLQAYITTGSIFFLFPVIAGVILFMCAFWAYEDPRGTYLSIIPAMMMTMSGMMVYYLVSFALAVDPEAGVSPTGAPVTMLLTAALCLFAIIMRERE